MDYKLQPQRMLRHWVSAPFIYAMIVPLVFLDVFLEIYHRICFRLYGLPLVSRREYIKIDRHRLAYLKWYDKLNCVYCGYANGLAAYLVRITGDTEKYWCGIKHNTAERPQFHEPAHHRDFARYGDEKAYKERFCKLGKKK